ncbi:murein transglycosylase A [Agaribacterium sp. ZY112]|uniref:murein transglycosylase A n=1 Tax=Agaribacterium sp. ZY112 TaxID=3233574 RepID=UPI0035269569
MNATRTIKLGLSVCLTFIITACHQSSEQVDERENQAQIELKETSFENLPNWQHDDLSAALLSFKQSCIKISTTNQELPLLSQITINTEINTHLALQKACQKAKQVQIKPDLARQFFEHNFQPWLIRSDNKEQGLFTGYYEASVNASYNQSAKYSSPIRKKPKDLVTVDLGLFKPELAGQNLVGQVVNSRLQPYQERKDIEASHTDDDEVLLWLDSAVDKFFLQIQGSGLAELDNGNLVRIAYAGNNGHNYSAIGKPLLQRGELSKESISMQSIKAWLNHHPEQAKQLMNTNKRYIFFREHAGMGPIGAQDVELSAERSLAIDPSYYAYGLPFFVDLEHPQKGSNNIQKLVIAQDTGSAIKGPLRGDFFWGHGLAAEENAGKMKSLGKAWVLLPKN